MHTTQATLKLALTLDNKAQGNDPPAKSLRAEVERFKGDVWPVIGVRRSCNPGGFGWGDGGLLSESCLSPE